MFQPWCTSDHKDAVAPDKEECHAESQGQGIQLNSALQFVRFPQVSGPSPHGPCGNQQWQGSQQPIEDAGGYEVATESKKNQESEHTKGIETHPQSPGSAVALVARRHFG